MQLSTHNPVNDMYDIDKSLNLPRPLQYKIDDVMTNSDPRAYAWHVHSKSRR